MVDFAAALRKKQQAQMAAARDIKTSTVKSFVKSGEPYSLDPAITQVAMGQAYHVVFEDGGEGLMAGRIDAEPVVIGNTYHYYITVTKAGNKKVNLSPIPAGVAPKDIAAMVPGVTTADKVAQTTTADPVTSTGSAGGSGGTTSAPVNPAPATSPQLQPNTNPMKPVTEKAQTLNDTTPRKGTVKIVRFVETYTPKDDPTNIQYKYVVTFDDGAHGIIWGKDQEKPPLSLGQEILYAFGKVYQDGSKRIDVAPSGSNVDMALVNVRLACLNAAVGVQATVLGPTTEAILTQATAFEKHLLRPVE